MLTDLDIVNFAIIERLHVGFGPGFNVITGETGAGKSIVIDAVGSILGGKTGNEFLRTGFDQAHVEGVFAVDEETNPAELRDVLADHGLEIEDGTLILSRDLYRSGRSVSRINGRAVPISVLQQVGQALVDIHGQSEHLSLLRPPYQLDLLDEFAGTLELRAEVATAVADLRRVRNELDRLNVDERELARRADLLRFQVDEIAAAKLLPNEDEDLRQERTLLVNAEKLAAGADTVYKALYASDEESSSALDSLGRASAVLTDLTHVDPSLQSHTEAIESAVYQVEEVGRAIRSYRDAVEFNPSRLQEVEERLDLILTLKRKYGSTIEEINEYGRRSAAELDSLVHSEERRAKLLEEERESLQRAGVLAVQLSNGRRAAADALSSAIERELMDLHMKGARFAILIEQTADEDGLPSGSDRAEPRFAFDTTGIDRVTFLISPNPGEPLKPLAKIASGGEMSRLLLALKTVLSRADRIGTLIFDEVDVGVGGRSGRVIGEKLASLAAQHQVICITHLPQVACFADVHYRIVKEVVDGRTVTRLNPLDEYERVDELAAMMAGSGASATARQSAAELVGDATLWKEQIRGTTKAVG